MLLNQFLEKKLSIGIVGLGYVGLPLGELLARKFSVVGFDINETRVSQLSDGIDVTREISSKSLARSTMKFTTEPTVLQDCKIIIVTVPTPIDDFKKPDLFPVHSATETIARNLRPGTIVVYESTVYPGVTEEECVPILEKISGLKWKKDFNVGYSPERVNPGDKNHTIDKIKKVVSGDTDEVTKLLEGIYGSVISAGIFVATSIKTAEAAKVIENTQRDLNIALMNELSLIFSRMGINTLDVLEAAGSKWNFIKFYPGLVGGHCIGVDPYYLTHKSEGLGYHPQVILAGRRINDGMGRVVAEATVKKIIKAGKDISSKGKVLICGFTFKENVPDLRNTKVLDIYQELEGYGLEPVVYDPMLDPAELKEHYEIGCIPSLRQKAPYLAVVFAVPHQEFMERLNLRELMDIQIGKPIIFDIKGVWRKEAREFTELDYVNL